MKKNFSLWRILREELESERRDLIFVIFLIVPVSVALIVACFHLFCFQPALKEVSHLLEKSIVVMQQSMKERDQEEKFK